MYAFRGRDRRLIQKAIQVLNAIKARDQLALNTNKKTTKLSTRTPILDNNNTTGGLLFAANQLLTQLNFVNSAVIVP